MNWVAIVSGLMCVVSYWIGWFVCNYYSTKEIEELEFELECLKSDEKHYEKAEPLSDEEKNMVELLRKRKKEGKIVFFVLGDLMQSTPEIICNQPADGLLWDLNRDEVTCVTFAHNDPTWVNNFAVAQVIRFLHGEYMKNKIDT